MSHAGPTLKPALAVLAVGAVVLLLAEATWLQLTSAIGLLIGIALAVFAIATPAFLEGDLDGDDRGD